MIALEVPALALTVDPPFPGRTGRDNVVRASGATPGATLRLVLGGHGSEAVPGCPGLRTDVTARWVSGSVVADGLGEAWFDVPVPGNAEGRQVGLQVVDRASCSASTPVWHTWPERIDRDLGSAEAKLVGVDADDASGCAISGAGDVNADGFDDVLIGAFFAYRGYPEARAGAAYLLYGPLSGGIDLAHAEATFTGERSRDYAGWSVSGAGDVNADGFADLLVGAPSANGDWGATYLILGPPSVMSPLRAADARLLGSFPHLETSRAVSLAGDTNGDGLSDILIGAPMDASPDPVEIGVAYLIESPVAGDVDLETQARARLLGEQDDDYAGGSVADAGDVNGDGIGDILIGAPKAGAGIAYLVHGPMAGDVPLATADARLLGEFGDNAGYSVSGAGDVDADGLPDLLVGAWTKDGLALNGGGAYLLTRRVSGDVPLGTADASLLGSILRGYAGYSVSDAGDIDADGVDDVLVGTYDSERAYGVLGPLWGTFDLANADVIFLGEASEDFAGRAVSGAGDTNADGFADILVGAYGSDAGGSLAGSTYLVLGGPL